MLPDDAIVDYLLRSSAFPPTKSKPGAAIVILVLYYLLLLPLLICYARLLQTILARPGYVPRSPQWHVRKESKRPQKGRHRRRSRHSSFENEKALSTAAFSARGEPEGAYWQRDIFVCQYDGRPRFCSQCYTFKVDRVHHCSEVNRCVRKMDHFCPWVGGIISETSFKWFLQFTFYTALYTFFTLVVVSYYFAERRRMEAGFINVHWILLLAFAALFLLFGAGMFSSSFQLAWNNLTTVENLSRRTQVHYVAVYLSKPEETLCKNKLAGRPALRTITYPRPPAETVMVLEQHGADIPPLSQSNTVSPPSAPGLSEAITDTAGSAEFRTFAILETPGGMNLWNVGPFNNLRSVLGEHLVDWIVPLKHSPCMNHDSGVSMYKMNPEFHVLIQDAGVELQDDAYQRSGRRRRRRRKSRTRRHSEDPDVSRRSRIHRSRSRSNADSTPT